MWHNRHISPALLTNRTINNIINKLGCHTVYWSHALRVPIISTKNYNITLSLPNCCLDNFSDYYIKRGCAFFFIEMVFLSTICTHSHRLSLKIYYNGIPFLFFCQRCSRYNFKHIIIFFKFVKYAHYIKLNKKCINISWELLDKVYKNIISLIKLTFNKLEYV